MSFVGLLREIGASKGNKFAAIGDHRAALAARIAFDFAEVAAVALDGPGADAIKAKYTSAIAPVLATTQVSRQN